MSHPVIHYILLATTACLHNNVPSSYTLYPIGYCSLPTQKCHIQLHIISHWLLLLAYTTMPHPVIHYILLATAACLHNNVPSSYTLYPIGYCCLPTQQCPIQLYIIFYWLLLLAYTTMSHPVIYYPIGYCWLPDMGRKHHKVVMIIYLSHTERQQRTTKTSKQAKWFVSVVQVHITNKSHRICLYTCSAWLNNAHQHTSSMPVFTRTTTVKPVFKTTWEIGTTWELRTATSVPMPIQDSFPQSLGCP